MLEQNDMDKCFSILRFLGILQSLTTMIVALVVGFMYFSCNQKISTWLLVTGFICPTIFILGTIINCFPVKDILKAEKVGEVVNNALLPAVFIFTYIGVSIFFIAWTIYGAVLFFPLTTGPYPACRDGEDDVKVLVITSIIIIILKTIFLFCPSFITIIVIKVWRSRVHKDDTMEQGGNTEEQKVG